MDPMIGKIDSCVSGQKRNDGNILEPLWFDGHQFLDELRSGKRKKDGGKTLNEDTSEKELEKTKRLQRFSAVKSVARGRVQRKW